MKSSNNKEYLAENQPLLLALHSCSPTLGIATLNSKSPKETLQSSQFEIGRNLSNEILECVDKVLPTSKWKQIGRLSVAIGPGGFTGMRITIVMARTLAQQLQCQLDGISSFALMASRLSKDLSNDEKYEPFWIGSTLSRRGLIAG